MTASLLIDEEGRLRGKAGFFVSAADPGAKFILFLAERRQLFLNRRDVRGE
jgi:hypothetical protein